MSSATYREAHREEIREKARARYLAKREEILAYQERYYDEHRDDVLDRVKSYREANAESIRAQRKAFREANRDHLFEQRRRNRKPRPATPERRHQKASHEAARRARKRAAYVEFVDRVTVYERDKGLCGICGQEVDRDDFHLDHIVPLSLGGAHSYANTQLAHPTCNQRKYNRTAFYWAADHAGIGARKLEMAA